MSLTGDKRKRDNDEDEEEEDENSSLQPPEKKRKVEEVSSCVIEEISSFILEFFRSSSSSLTDVRNGTGSMAEKLDQMLDIVKSDGRAKESKDVRMMVFLIEYYRHEVNPLRLGRMLANANSGDFSMIRTFFTELVKPTFENLISLPILEQQGQAGKQIDKQTIKQSVKKQFDNFSQFFNHFVCGIFDEIIDSQGKGSSSDEQVKDEDDDDDEESEIISHEIKSVRTRCPVTQEVMFLPLRNPNCGHHYSEEGVKHQKKQQKWRVPCPVVGCNSFIPPLSSLKRNSILEREIKKKYNEKNHRDEKEDRYISIVVQSWDGCKVEFKMKKTTKFELVRKQFCNEMGIDPNRFVFKFDGETLDLDGTPQKMEMENGDVIDIAPYQTG